MKKICIVAGARPNFIKVAPVIRAIRNAQEAGNEISYQLVYTGKEDDPTLESSLFDDLGILTRILIFPSKEMITST